MIKIPLLINKTQHHLHHHHHLHHRSLSSQTKSTAATISPTTTMSEYSLICE
ncbi:hypothetical protein Hanom_Chr04g00338341 [Helianthus anomalus]